MDFRAINLNLLVDHLADDRNRSSFTHATDNDRRLIAAITEVLDLFRSGQARPWKGRFEKTLKELHTPLDLRKFFVRRLEDLCAAPPPGGFGLPNCVVQRGAPTGGPPRNHPPPAAGGGEGGAADREAGVFLIRRGRGSSPSSNSDPCSKRRAR